jgi:hypothetical protein
VFCLSKFGKCQIFNFAWELSYKGRSLFGLDETGTAKRCVAPSTPPFGRIRIGPSSIQVQRLQGYSYHRIEVKRIALPFPLWVY